MIRKLYLLSLLLCLLVVVKYTNRYTWEFVAIPAILICLLAYFLPGGSNSISDEKTWRLPWLSVGLVALSAWALFDRVFQGVDISAILYHLKGGVEDTAMTGLVWPITQHIVMAIIMIISLGYFIARHGLVSRFDKLAALPLLLWTPFFFPYVSDPAGLFEPTDQLSEFYQEINSQLPTGIQKKNLILIYMESTEGTLKKLPVSPPVFGDLVPFENKGTSFSAIGQTYGTGYTMAGLVATQCGMPLLTVGLLSTFSFEDIGIIPGALCLGDILSAQGYRVEYMGGASANFGAKGLFLETHGYGRVRGYGDYENIPAGYVNDWGIYDDTLFEIAQDTVTELRQSEQPFMLSLLTISGHGPTGFPAQRCLDEIGPITLSKILFSKRCTSYLVAQFEKWLEEQGLLEDTIIVVMSDHFAAIEEFSMLPRDVVRSNYVAMAGPGVSPAKIQKTGAMFDVFPTLMQLMGFELTEGRAALGVSLLSETPSIYEELGQKELDRILARDKWLRAKIWEMDP